MKFLSPEVAMYVYKSIIRPCREYCCHVWSGATSCYLELSDELQSGYAGLLVLHLLPLLNPWLILEMQPSLSIFYRYYFGRFSSELAQLVPLLFSRRRSTCYSDRLHNFFCDHSQMLQGCLCQQDKYFQPQDKYLNILGTKRAFKMN